MAKNILEISIKADSDFSDLSKIVEQAKDARNDIVATALKETYRRKELKELRLQIGPKVFKKIAPYKTAPLFAPMNFVSSTGDAVQAMKWCVDESYRMSLEIMDTGKHSESYYMYQGTFGGKEKVVPTTAQLKTIPDGVYTLINITPYAAWLERFSLPTGLMYNVYSRCRRKFGANISIKYDYIHSKHFTTQHGNNVWLPRIQIAAPGRLRNGAVRPNKKGRKIT